MVPITSMGTTPSNVTQPDEVHPLTQSHRRLYVISGFIHLIRELDKAIPNDIKSIVNSYLEGMDNIRSKTDIDALIQQEQIRRLKMVRFLDFYTTFILLQFYVMV